MRRQGRVLSPGQNSSEVNEQAIRLYMWLLRYYAEHGYAPSIREMVTAAGFSSTSVVGYHIDILVQWKWLQRGYIDKATGQLVRGERDIRPIRPTERGLSAEEIARLYGWEAVAFDYPVKLKAAHPRRQSKRCKPLRELNKLLR